MARGWWPGQGCPFRWDRSASLCASPHISPLGLPPVCVAGLDPADIRLVAPGRGVWGKECQLDPSSQGKEEECSTCRRHSQGKCLQLAWDGLQEQRPFCSQRPVPTAREVVGWSFQEAWASALPSGLGDGHRAASSLRALCLTSGVPCDVETVADAGSSWALQTHLIRFNNH